MRHAGILAVALLVSACSGDHGFRFHAEYGAPRTGYHVTLISRGWVESGDDLSENAYEVAQFCPVSPSVGARPFRLTLTSVPRQFTTFASPDLGLPPTEAKDRRGDQSSEGIVRGLLVRAGYASPDSTEVLRTLRVLQHALAGPKGVVLEGQIDSLDVVSTKVDYSVEVQKDRPRESWFTAAELPTCGA